MVKIEQSSSNLVLSTVVLLGRVASLKQYLQTLHWLLTFSKLEVLVVGDYGIVDYFFADFFLLLHELDHVGLVKVKTFLQSLESTRIVLNETVIFVLKKEDFGEEVLDMGLEDDVLGFVELGRDFLEDVAVELRQYFEEQGADIELETASVDQETLFGRLQTDGLGVGALHFCLHDQALDCFFENRSELVVQQTF
jgi:hypothetical protein